MRHGMIPLVTSKKWKLVYGITSVAIRISEYFIKGKRCWWNRRELCGGYPRDIHKAKNHSICSLPTPARRRHVRAKLLAHDAYVLSFTTICRSSFGKESNVAIFRMWKEGEITR